MIDNSRREDISVLVSRSGHFADTEFDDKNDELEKNGLFVMKECVYLILEAFFV